MPPSHVNVAVRCSSFCSRLVVPLSKKPAPSLPILPARHHSTTPVLRTASYSTTSFRPRILTQLSPSPTKCISSSRYSSTATPTVDDASTSSTNVPSTSTTSLTWTDFFAMRKRRRITNLITSSVTGTMTLFVGAASMPYTDLATLGAQKFGADPMLFAGLLTAASGGLGWLAGPFIGNGVWRIANRGRVEVFNFVSPEEASTSFVNFERAFLPFRTI